MTELVGIGFRGFWMTQGVSEDINVLAVGGHKNVMVPHIIFQAGAQKAEGGNSTYTQYYETERAQHSRHQTTASTKGSLSSHL